MADELWVKWEMPTGVWSRIYRPRRRWESSIKIYRVRTGFISLNIAPLILTCMIVSL